MPCESDPKDYEDALRLSRSLDMETMTVALDPVYSLLLQLLPEGSRLSEANLKPRLRMLCLHYMANARSWLVAGTSNKSELLVGYFTKYGDSGVDFMPVADVYKTEIFEMARELDIPQEIIDRPPSAGLWQNQTDEEEMGITYHDLDHALRAIENGGPTDVDPDILDRVKNMIAHSAHKRDFPPIYRNT
jgi:NAD+ synthase